MAQAAKKKKRPVKKQTKKPTPKAAPKKKKASVKKTPLKAKKTAPKKVSHTPKRLTLAEKTALIIEDLETTIRKRAKRPDDLVTAEMGADEILAHMAKGEKDELSIVESKFDIGVHKNAESLRSMEIPSEYGKDQVKVLVVDPRFVFTYWEVRHDTFSKAASKMGHGAKLTLRFYDITNTDDLNMAPNWDVEVFDRLGNWYLRLSNPEQKICLDVGLRSASGEFWRFARSNVMRLPAQSLAKPGPIKWMIVTPAGDRLISDVEEYTDADLELLKKILGPYFFDLLMRGRFASIAGSSVEAVFFDVNALKVGESPSSGPPWNK